MNLYLKIMRLFIFFVALFCVGCQENSFSDAALEEFFVLDRSIDANNKIVAHSTKITIAVMRETAKTKIGYLPLAKKASEIKTIALDFHAYIDELRDSLVAKSGGLYTKELAEKQGKLELEGRPIGQNDKKIPHQIFISGYDDIRGKKEPQGVVLHKKILALRDIYIDVIAKMWDNGGIKGTVFIDSSKKAACIEQLKAEMALYSIDSYRPETHGNKTWAEFTFGNMPVAAIYPILRKLQNDAILLEDICIKFLDSNIGKMHPWNYEEWSYFTAYPFKSIVQLGEDYEAQLQFVTYYSDINFSLSINNQNIKVENGRAAYKIKPTSIGKKKYTAKIGIKKTLTGEIETFTKDFYYEVSK